VTATEGAALAVLAAVFIYVSSDTDSWRSFLAPIRSTLVDPDRRVLRGALMIVIPLLVGYYDETGLRYAGKVGTGFDTATLVDVHRQMLARARDSSPFVDRVRERGAHWVEPDLVANVAFTEWTADGKLRHPRYEGLRPDKDSRRVTRETPPNR